MVKHQKELYELRQTEADLVAEISGAQGQLRNLKSRIAEFDQRYVHLLVSAADDVSCLAE